MVQTSKMKFRAISTSVILFSLLIGSAFTWDTSGSSYSSASSSLFSTYDTSDSSQNSYSEYESSASDNTLSSRSETTDGSEYEGYLY